MSTSEATPFPGRSPAGNEFVISRTFDAPRDLVWQAWSEAERLARWWGPKGFDIHVAKLDFRPGGIFHYRMATKNGQEMWGRFIYQEITAPERTVFISSFSNETGNVARAPFFDGGWPLEVHNTLTLVENGGRTTLTIRAYPIHATDAERKTFESNFDSMRQGFGGTFDQLAEYLVKT